MKAVLSLLVGTLLSFLCLFGHIFCDLSKEYISFLGLLLFIHKIMFIFQAFALVAYAQEGSKCVSVNPVPSFDYAKFEGMW